MSEIGQSIIKAVREKAAENPLFVYDVGADFCKYVIDGQPSCLIGHALWDLHIIDANLENAYEGYYNNIDVQDLFTHLGTRLDPEEVGWLTLAQQSQDAKSPWGKAVDWADNFDEEMLNNW